LKKLIVVLILLGGLELSAFSQERQLTFDATGHDLDNNDNFSADNEWLCFDTRETDGPGIEECTSIAKVHIESGEIVDLYRPDEFQRGARPAPGVGAVSYNRSANEVAFIHGPPMSEVPERGAYGKPNRNGARVTADGSGDLTWLDYRDVATDRDTLPGAHRGGTHRHEYTWDGGRIGFTYDDFLTPQYDRTVGYMEPHAEAPGGASHYVALLVPVMPRGTAKPGELEKAWGDSWVGKDGRMRAFIGKVRNDDGKTYEQSLFVADIPVEIDITTADSGSASRFPSPPNGIKIRRLTNSWAEGIVRGSSDGKWIAYYGKSKDGTTQVFLIHAEGEDEPKQVTNFPEGTSHGLRWHPSGQSIFTMSKNGVVAVCVSPGELFGNATFLTDQGIGPERTKLAISWDGKMLAFNRPVPMRNEDGAPIKNYAGEDHLQIFVLPFPDKNGNGIADEIE
jgi:hypothetical protein